MKKTQEGLIKRIEVGKVALEHNRWRDDFGFLHDTFDLIKTKSDRHQIHYPMLPPIKANNYTRETSITDMCTDYSEEEMLQFLHEQMTRPNFISDSDA